MLLRMPFVGAACARRSCKLKVLGSIPGGGFFDASDVGGFGHGLLL